MKTRGRNPAGVVVPGGFDERPNPPSDLTTRQRELWREVVASEDPGFFKTAVCRQLLMDYCRRRATGEEITQVIEASAWDWLRDADATYRYEQLLRMRDRENAATITLATKLRLTNQSRYVSHAAAHTAQKAVAAEDLPWRKSA